MTDYIQCLLDQQEEWGESKQKTKEFYKNRLGTQQAGKKVRQPPISPASVAPPTHTKPHSWHQSYRISQSTQPENRPWVRSSMKTPALQTQNRADTGKKEKVTREGEPSLPIKRDTTDGAPTPFNGKKRKRYPGVGAVTSIPWWKGTAVTSMPFKNQANAGLLRNKMLRAQQAAIYHTAQPPMPQFLSPEQQNPWPLHTLDAAFQRDGRRFDAGFELW